MLKQHVEGCCPWQSNKPRVLLHDMLLGMIGRPMSFEFGPTDARVFLSRRIM
jgi:hypothetical protein